MDKLDLYNKLKEIIKESSAKCVGYSFCNGTNIFALNGASENKYDMYNDLIEDIKVYNSKYLNKFSNKFYNDLKKYHIVFGQTIFLF